MSGERLRSRSRMFRSSSDIHGLDLQRFHEALSFGIVVGITSPAPGADEAVVGEQIAVSLRGILRTSIRVVDAAPVRLPDSDGCLEGCNSQTGIDRAADRISDHPA